MKYKYKIGDELKVVDAKYNDIDVIGKYVTIIGVDKVDDKVPYFGRSDLNDAWWFAESDLEPIPDEPISDKDIINAYFQSIHAAAVKQPEVSDKAQILLSAFFSELADLVNRWGEDAGKL